MISAKSDHAPVILLTGPPGIGKSTVIRKVLDSIKPYAAGFYTREVREKGERSGFEIFTLADQQILLASKSPTIHFTRTRMLGSYKINLDAVDRVAIPALEQAIALHKITIIDEIGPMEIFSPKFCDIVSALLEQHNVPILGTIVERPNWFADKVKIHPRVTIVPVTPQNRDALPAKIVAQLKTHT